MTTVTTRLHPRHMSLATFMALPESEGRVQELLDGELVVSPTGIWRHSRIIGQLQAQLSAQVDARRLGQTATQQTVILDERNAPQPDVAVIVAERLHILQRGYPRGAPDLAIEVLSPSNRAHDLVRKKRIYERLSVREYWIVDGDTETVTRFFLHRGRYGKCEVRSRSIRLRILPQVRVDLASIWRLVGDA